MIILLHRDCDEQAAEEVVAAVRALGLEAVRLDESRGRALEVIGAGRSQVLALRDAPGVEEILTRRTPVAGTEPLWPHGAVQFGILMLVLLSALLLLTGFVPPGLGDEAAVGTYSAQPTHEWYLRPLAAFHDLFKGAPRWLGGLVVLLLWIGLLLWPFFDTVTGKAPRDRRLLLLIRLLGVGLMLLAILLALRPIA